VNENVLTTPMTMHVHVTACFHFNADKAQAIIPHLSCKFS